MKVSSFVTVKPKTKTNIHLFDCNTRATPFKYISIPICHKKLFNSDWLIIEEVQCFVSEVWMKVYQ